MQSNTEAAYKGMSSASSSYGGHGSSSGPSVLTVARWLVSFAHHIEH